ncbi:circadian clock KaiB family protein [Methylobacterium sp. Leaf118]|uniref:circadian clock KaiB family protein n=1 Tax=Methylobacterium sp. Leaf118 TaxID=2876562 RepID=UPI001E41BD79|nr:circadian clock KaiB family protein [Methylobacterium sp. Leaf118]
MSPADPSGASAPAPLRLRLYVAGTAPRSSRTIESLRQLCGRSFGEAYELEVVDLYQQPGLAAEDGVVAAPTLVRLAPLPARRLAGDLGDEDRVLQGLGLDRRAEEPAP